jgi:inositol-polyphosphate multikinase
LPFDSSRQSRFVINATGSDGTLCDPDGELFIKPCTQQEIEFYESAQESHKRFAELMPLYIGTLSLNGATGMESLNEQLPAVAEHISEGMKEEALRMAKENAADIVVAGDNVKWLPNKNRKIPTNKSVVLENAAWGYSRPNILDAKLGQRLWADDAPLEKKRRFDEISKATTNGSHGFRIAGMRVYKGSDDPEELDAEGYKVFDKDFGRFHVNGDNIVDEMRKFIFNSRAGVDEELGRAVAGAFVEDLKRVENILANEESRMYSASLLFTFEGDGDALRAAIEQTVPSTSTSQLGRKEKVVHVPGLSTSRVDSGIVLDDNNEFVLQSAEKDYRNGNVTLEQVQVFELGSESDFLTQSEMDEDIEDDEDDEMSSLPRIYSVKLIDFAHAKWVPGHGPDENSLLGVRSLIKIFEELSR